MRKRVLALALAFPLLLILTASAFAADLRIRGNCPVLSFNKSTATCSVLCQGNNLMDKIEATLTIYQGDTYVDSWSDSGTMQVYISKTCKVESGKSYSLVLDYSINGESKRPVSISATCP